MTVLGIVVFVVALLASITLHEAGHLITAKRFGMKATQFFVGFGPTVWSRQKGETEYGVKALPLGGFCKIIGMTPLEDEDIEPRDRHRAFFRQPGPQRAVVLSAGSFTHFLIAFVVLLFIGMGLGVPQRDNPTTAVAQVAQCVPKKPTGTCEAGGQATSPAARAGLDAGDKIVAFAGQQVGSWKELRKAISSKQPGQTVTLTVVRGGERHQLRTTLARDPDGKGAFFGMVAKPAVEHYGPLESVAYAGTTIGNMVVASGKVVAALPQAIPNLFSEDRGSTPGGTVTSVVGAASIAGQVADVDRGWLVRIRVFLLLLVSLNVFVGLFNMLPLLPLDGGHLAVVCYERGRARIARLRGRPEPGHVDMRKLTPATAVVFVLLIGFGVLLIVADIVNPLRL